MQNIAKEWNKTNINMNRVIILSQMQGLAGDAHVNCFEATSIHDSE